MAPRLRSTQDTVHPRGTLPAPVGLAGHWLQPVLAPVTSAKSLKGPQRSGPGLRSSSWLEYSSQVPARQREDHLGQRPEP